MTTDLERLHDWMERNGHGSKSLSKLLLYTADYIAPVLAGRRSIHDGLAWRFAGVFGEQAHNEVFSESLAERAARVGVKAEHRIAHLAITSAIECGLFGPADHYFCRGCDKRAMVWHHPSYYPHDVLCVVPLCGSCHKYLHNGSKSFNFGVVPTRVGLVRIAIAAL